MCKKIKQNNKVLKEQIELIKLNKKKELVELEKQ
mgnify:FL=1